MIDAVLSYHLNGAVCGVAKFNQLLAAKLGVPCKSYYLYDHARRPLASIKFSEMRDQYLMLLPKPYELMVHDLPVLDVEWQAVLRADRVIAANPVIARRLREQHHDVVEGFCPSTLQGNPHRAPLNVLTFGMAHKLQLPYYEKLKALLDATGQDYTVSVSTAVHEGSPWDAVSEAGEKLRAIFQDRTRALGYLADDALARELQDCSAVAMFFDPALRANNTTFWAAVDAGVPVLTNLDGDSPQLPQLGHFLLNIDTVNALPEWLPGSGAWRQFGIPHDYTWDRLLQTLGVSVSV